MIRYYSIAALAVFALVGMAAVSRAADPVVTGACCEARGENVCVRVPDIKKTTKRVYTDVCEPLCLPKCRILGGLWTRGDSGEHCDCECHMWTKKTLIVKLRTCEEPTTKCVAQPACAPCAAK